MGLVKTRRLAAMQKQQRAKAVKSAVTLFTSEENLLQYVAPKSKEEGER
jgi:hypothetical protein